MKHFFIIVSFASNNLFHVLVTGYLNLPISCTAKRCVCLYTHLWVYIHTYISIRHLCNHQHTCFRSRIMANIYKAHWFKYMHTLVWKYIKANANIYVKYIRCGGGGRISCRGKKESSGFTSLYVCGCAWYTHTHTPTIYICMYLPHVLYKIFFLQIMKFVKVFSQMACIAFIFFVRLW